MNKFLSAIVTVTSLSGFASNVGASSSIALQIDCNDSAVESESTTDQIIVEFLSNGKVVGKTSESHAKAQDLIIVFGIPLSSINHYSYPRCNSITDAVYEINNVNATVDAVRLTTNGTDAFFIDNVAFGAVTRATNVVQGTSTPQTTYSRERRIGGDGGGGYCLSNDPEDGNGAWRNHVAGCYRSITFDLNDGTFTVVRGTYSRASELTAKVLMSNVAPNPKARLSCGSPPVENPASNDILSLVIKDSSGKPLTMLSGPMGQSCGNHNFQFKSMESLRDAVSLQITTSGSDALFIDTLEFEYYDYKSEKTKTLQWGQRGGQGWCLSTDPTDGNGNWKNSLVSMGCVASLEFGIERMSQSSWRSTAIKQVPSERFSSYRVVVDCDHSDIGTEAGTLRSALTLVALDRNGTELEQYETRFKDKPGNHNARTARCDPFGLLGRTERETTVQFIVPMLSERAVKFSLRTTSANAMYVDQFKVLERYQDSRPVLISSTEKIVKHAGRDNGSGWCLSTEVSDNLGNDWSPITSGSCRSSLPFSIRD